MCRYRVNEELHVTVAAQTPDEARIAERYLSVLADISRCAEAVRDGDWPLWERLPHGSRRAAVCGWSALRRSGVAGRPFERVVGRLLPARLDTGEV